MVHSHWCSLAGFGGGVEAPTDLVHMGVSSNIRLQENENLGVLLCRDLQREGVGLQLE